MVILPGEEEERKCGWKREWKRDSLNHLITFTFRRIFTQRKRNFSQENNGHKYLCGSFAEVTMTHEEAKGTVWNGKDSNGGRKRSLSVLLRLILLILVAVLVLVVVLVLGIVVLVLVELLVSLIHLGVVHVSSDVLRLVVGVLSV